MSTRVVVACVGNMLRGDDGFGQAVADELGDLPSGAELVETGIGGIALVQELMRGCSGLVIVDAIDRGEPPGTLVAFEPPPEPPVHVADVHLANPRRVLAMAAGLGVLPPRILVVGCQPEQVDVLGTGLSPSVRAAVEPAAVRVRKTVENWLAEVRAAPA